MLRPASVSEPRNSDGEPSDGTDAAVNVAVPTIVGAPTPWVPAFEKKFSNRKPVVVLPLASASDTPLVAVIVTWFGTDRSTVSSSPPPPPPLVTVRLTGTSTSGVTGSL